MRLRANQEAGLKKALQGNTMVGGGEGGGVGTPELIRIQSEGVGVLDKEAHCVFGIDDTIPHGDIFTAINASE